ncbi:MAG: hypothetical protein ABW099_01960 [Candidatus Binatia bacterium]
MRTIVLFIVLTALILRVAAAILIPDQTATLPDSGAYRAAAEHFRNTLRIDTPIFMPLYPALLALVGTGLGQLLLDSTLSAILVWLVFELSMSLFGDVLTATITAIFVAIYPHFIFFAAVGLTETLFMTLTVATFVCWYRNRFIAAAVFATLAILTRPTFDFIAPLLVVYFALAIHRLHVRGAVRQLFIYAVIYCAMMSPWWLHNYRAYGAFVRLDLGAGMALYSGNNPYSRGGGIDLELNEHMKPFAAISDPVERDRALRQAALHQIRDDPTGFIERAGLKFLRFWRLWPYTESYSNIGFVVASFLSFAPVLGLALAFLALRGYRNFRRIAPLLLFGGYLTCLHMIVPGSIRYRIPLEPFLIVLAGAGVVEIASKNRFGRWALDSLRARL